MKLITMLAVLSTLLYAQTPAQGPGRITVTVLNEDGQPVVHAATCISALGSHKTKCDGFTDQGGQFEIQHLPIGTFLVFATKEEDGYSRLSNQSTGQKVVLTPQEPSANITVKLAPKGGTIIGSARDSLAGKLVDLVHVAYIATDGQTSGGTGIGMGLGGEFRINLSTTSGYVIVITAPGYKPWIYTDPANGPSSHLASGEQKSVEIELVPDAKGVK